MNTQGNPTLPARPVFLQPAQSISQVSSLPPTNGGASNIPSNVQIWTPSSSGAITVSGLGQPRGSANFVTLPSGQTVLMTNFTTSTNLSSSLNKTQLPLTSGLPAGSQIVLSNHGSVPLSHPSIIQDPSNGISMALSGGLITQSTMNSFTVTTNTFVPSSSSSSVQLSDSQSLSAPNLPFNPNATFQNLTPMMLDSSNFNQTPNKILNNLSSVQSQLITSPSQQTITATVLQAANPTTCFATEVMTSQTNATISDTNLSSATTTSMALSSSDQNDTQVTVNDVVTTTSNLIVPSTSQITDVSLSVANGSSDFSANLQTQMESSKSSIHNQTSNSVFTPSSLNCLLSELDPHLQIDLDAEEVLSNLANEFITSCAEKAHKLAVHRGSSTVESKDVLFCMERDWNVIVPGYASEVRPQKRAAISEVHKQRMALIKKQIKKM